MTCFTFHNRPFLQALNLLQILFWISSFRVYLHLLTPEKQFQTHKINLKNILITQKHCDFPYISNRAWLPKSNKLTVVLVWSGDSWLQWHFTQATSKLVFSDAKFTLLSLPANITIRRIQLSDYEANYLYFSRVYHLLTIYRNLLQNCCLIFWEEVTENYVYLK